MAFWHSPRRQARLALTTAVILLMALAAACGGPAAPNDSDAGDNEQDQDLAGAPIRIGVLSPFSGPFASVGKLNVDIFDLLLADVNADGGINGRPLEFVAGDSGGAADEARNQALRLIEQEKVDLLLGAYLSEETVEIMEVAADRGVPFIIPTSAANEINAKIQAEPDRYRHVFRVGYNVTQWAQMMGDFIIDQGAGNYGYVGANIRWNQEFARELADYLAAHNIEPVFADMFYSPSQPVFEPAVQAIQDGTPAIVVLGDPGQNSVELAKRIRQAGLTEPVFSVGGALGDERAAATIEPLAELYFQAAAWRQSGPAAIEYFERFDATYGYPLVGYTDMLTYDAIQIIVGALRNAESISADAIAAAIAAGEFEGLAGTYTFGPDHQPPWQAGSALGGVVVQWRGPGDSETVWPR